MAVNNWQGTAAKVKQVTTITVTGPVLVGEHWTVQVGNKSTTVTGYTTTTQVCNAIQAALTVSGVPAEFGEMTWVSSNPVVTGTAVSARAGWPITVSVSTDSAGGTIVAATATTATGPNFVDNTTNWSAGSLPSSSDTVNFGIAENGPMFALSALAAVATTNVNVTPDCNYSIGLPLVNGNGYLEYRQRDMQFDGGSLYCNAPNTSLMRFNFLAAAFTAQVDATGSNSLDQFAPVLNITGSAATNSLEVNGGQVGIAAVTGETATVKTFTQTNGTVTFGAGCTLNGSGSAFIIRNGSATMNSALLTMTVATGTGTIEGSGAITTLTVQPSGRWIHNSSGTITTLNLYGYLDLSQDASAKAVTTLNFHAGATINRNDLLTVTTPVLGTDIRTVSCS